MNTSAPAIFCTHRELESRRGWQETPPCPGRMRVVEQETLVWTVECDACGLEIGVPPKQQANWFAQQRGRYGESTSAAGESTPPAAPPVAPDPLRLEQGGESTPPPSSRRAWRQLRRRRGG